MSSGPRTLTANTPEPIIMSCEKRVLPMEMVMSGGTNEALATQAAVSAFTRPSNVVLMT